MYHQLHINMYIEFEKDYLRDLYETGKCSNKKYRLQPQIIKAYKRCVEKLITAQNIETLYQLHSLNYEVLTGEKAGISSVRINNKYRLEFKVKYLPDERIITICLILDITNHYQ